MEAPPRLEPGRIWDGYVVDSLLGEGASSAVYLVQRASDNSFWALKVLSTTDPRQRVRVEQEAIFRDELRHPNIVPAVQALDIDGRPGLVMDFIEGPSLDQWVATQDPDLLARLQVFRHVLDAVRFAHEQGVVHRDLKPSNVLMQPDGRGYVPRVADFGLGKAMAPEVGRFGGLTTVNTGLGSPGYAAPEQIRDASSVDERADLFSLGCLLYELLCGTGPFAGLSTFDTLRASSSGEYADPAILSPEAPSDAHALIRELMSPEPRDRPVSADAVCRRLDRMLTSLTDPGPMTLTSDDVSSIRLFSGLRVAGGAPAVPLTLLAMLGVPMVALGIGTAVVILF